MSNRQWGGRRAQRLVQLTLATYGDTCHWCGLPGADSADHLIPRSHGGDDSLDNLRPIHRRCNSSRGNRPLTTRPSPALSSAPLSGLGFFKPASPDTPRSPENSPPDTQQTPQIITLESLNGPAHD